ncbi:ArsR family transcriptional regulator [Geoglobus acetivorans]|uniref:ArsR family transcriptional regulator n=1 Tax=Geoglobus acetivorans TaxID=565033 RepID=A0A0A7GDX9_GEOAI|nr:Transcriptional regulator, ArsR family [Geoglobus acetivorans]MBE8539869.1 ArsR family transcriptional regulator [Geoglobus acetivorans]
MVRRAKLVNDAVELVPVLQLFSTETYRRVYETLLSEWRTLEELKQLYGEGVEEALRILKNAGMLEIKWRMPSDPAGKPEKEYHVSYTHLSINVYISLKELNTILNAIFMAEDEESEIVDRILEQIGRGRISVQHISRETGLDNLFIRALAKKSLKLNLKGQLVEPAKNEEV